MKLTTIVGALLAPLVVTLYAFQASRGRRECEHNAFGDGGRHADGMVPFAAEEAFGTRYLLAQKGSAANGILINAAGTRPLGVCVDKPDSGDTVAVAILGVAKGTQRFVASKAIAAGAKLFTAAGGKVTDTYASGAFFIGRAISAASADGEVIECTHQAPLLDASGTTL